MCDGCSSSIASFHSIPALTQSLYTPTYILTYPYSLCLCISYRYGKLYLDILEDSFGKKSELCGLPLINLWKIYAETKDNREQQKITKSLEVSLSLSLSLSLFLSLSVCMLELTNNTCLCIETEQAASLCARPVRPRGQLDSITNRHPQQCYWRRWDR